MKSEVAQIASSFRLPFRKASGSRYGNREDGNAVSEETYVSESEYKK